MNIAIIGATGLVGREILNTLNQINLLNTNKIFLYASSKSAGSIINIGKQNFIVKELKEDNLEERYDYALFSAGGKISKLWAEKFVNRGAIVIDNSSAFRRDDNVPLVVPEVNFKTIKNNNIIANPNCSTIGVALPLYVLNQIYNIKKVIISTYQAVSGAGNSGINDLVNGTNNKFTYQIRNNLIPQIDVALNNGYTFEEDKMDFELKKILNNKKIKISATCVRVPIINCHSESVYVEFNEKPDINLIKDKLKKFKGIKLLDNLSRNIYPMPCIANGKNDIYIGRLRKDNSSKKAISFFLSFDNVRKGASLNAVQILEKLIKKHKK